MDKNTFYITTPIYFPSGNLHIGHSYTTAAADAMARYKRARGYDVMFLTGTDEHGQKIADKANEKGVAPKEYVDEIVAGIKNLWDVLKISYDKYIRTTDDYHVRAVQNIFKRLYDRGDIYKSNYEGWYCTPCESFWTGTQLADGKCPDCGREVKLTKEESYFFRLSKYQDRILEYIEKNPEFIQPASRKNEMVNNFIKPGLQDVCVSRTTFDWGVPVTFDEKHIVYVWIDALTNYITALGYESGDTSLFEKYWPAQVHLVGKEIVRFHTIIWPALLMALDLPLPHQVFGHGWILLDGGKMSKSKANVIDPLILADMYGADAIRYFLLREVPFGSDSNFSNEALINRINTDLANDLGNLVSRTAAMIEKYFGGVIPEEKVNTEFDEDLISTVLDSVPKAEDFLEKFQFSNALAEIWKGVSRANKYIDETAPWILAKGAAGNGMETTVGNEAETTAAREKFAANKKKLAAVLYNLSETLRIVSILIGPFMPDTSAEIQRQMGIGGGAGAYAGIASGAGGETAVQNEILNWESSKKWNLTPAGTKVRRGGIIFPRIEV